MNYEQTLSWLYEQLPMYSRIGASAYKKDIGNISSLVEKLENPQHNFKSIHIAGTNGKGSTSHMLGAVLQSSGYKTGLYTSPHIFDFRERIKVDGVEIDKDFIIEFVERIKIQCEDLKPSFFEVTVAMAFEYFKQQKVDIAIIETGLGGRLDSTNIILPLVSVITSIGYDHTEILGNTLEEIAAEKAGIIKPEIPVIIGEVQPETKTVFDSKANELESPIIYAEEKYLIEYLSPDGAMLLVNLKNLDSGVVEKLSLDLTGLYQAKNARTALCIIDELRKLDFVIPERALHEGLNYTSRITGLRCRWEKIQNKPSVFLDVAHNQDGIELIIKQLLSEYQSKSCHFILGFVKDKDISRILPLFPKEANYYFTNAHIPRALPARELNQIAENYGLQGIAFDNVNEALQQAKLNSTEDDAIVICGSFFILSELKF